MDFYKIENIEIFSRIEKFLPLDKRAHVNSYFFSSSTRDWKRAHDWRVFCPCNNLFSLRENPIPLTRVWRFSPLSTGSILSCFWEYTVANIYIIIRDFVGSLPECLCIRNIYHLIENKIVQQIKITKSLTYTQKFYEEIFLSNQTLDGDYISCWSGIYLCHMRLISKSKWL